MSKHKINPKAVISKAIKQLQEQNDLDLKGVDARDTDGKSCLINSDQAVKFSMLGAIDRAYLDMWRKRTEKTARRIYDIESPIWNVYRAIETAIVDTFGPTYQGYKKFFYRDYSDPNDIKLWQGSKNETIDILTKALNML